MELPFELKTAIENELAGVPGGRLTSASAELSQRYRAGASSSGGFAESCEDVAAYAAVRLPATYAAVHAALRQAASGLTGFCPHSLMDCGAGPGTASWAAAAVWPGLEQITLIESEPAMIALGKRLAQSAPAPLARATWLRTDLAGEWQAEKHDVVILSYALGELPGNQREKLLRRLWERANNLLVVVEPGTPAGFSVVRQTRELFLQLNAAVLTPCPHNGPCPMQDSNWCHFSARVARSRLHRQVKGTELSYEDEKFSYIAVTTEAGAKPCAARVLRHPQILKGHVRLELCTKDGLKSVTVAKSRGEDYKKVRDLEWGDAAGFLV